VRFVAHFDKPLNEYDYARVRGWRVDGLLWEFVPRVAQTSFCEVCGVLVPLGHTNNLDFGSKEFCGKVRQRGLTMQKRARITSKGQITIPREVRRTLGVRAGDSLVFESDGRGVRVRPVSVEGRFAKYRGIGNPGIPSGRKGVLGWVRELRGK